MSQFWGCTSAICSKLYNVFFSLFVSVSDIFITFLSKLLHRMHQVSHLENLPSISLQFSFLALTVILLFLITFFHSSEDLIKTISHVLCSFQKPHRLLSLLLQAQILPALLTGHDLAQTMADLGTKAQCTH